MEVTNSRRRLEPKMNDKMNQRGPRKPYLPPQIAAISLRPEEAVLSHCKIMTGGGALGQCAPTGCHSNGS